MEHHEGCSGEKEWVCGGLYQGRMCGEPVCWCETCAVCGHESDSIAESI